jgi:hypothetical protein
MDLRLYFFIIRPLSSSDICRWARYVTRATHKIEIACDQGAACVVRDGKQTGKIDWVGG